MGSELDNLVGQAKIVIEIVLLAWVQHVSAVADGTLDHTAGSGNSLHTNLQLSNIVKGIENTEDINTILLGLLAEVIDGIVRETRM